ncbi:MAG: D-alanyl-D-alanine carboxypeptidase family protein [Lachnospiraceae bacterium]
MRYFDFWKKKYKRLICRFIILLLIICAMGNKNAISVQCATQESVDTGEPQNPNIQLNAVSACLIDGDTGRVLYGKNETERRAMASTTKIMTLIVILENANPDDIVTVSSNAARQPDVQLNINTGEQYLLRDLLYSMMLESHNDVAYALAEHVGGSVEGFAEMMNDKAQELGLKDTYFITPNGLDAADEFGKHSSTAVDMARLAAYGIQNEEFVKISNTQSYSFSEINGKRSFTVNNKNQFLKMMDGAIGVKTGFTGEAGYCFVGALQQEGRTFVSVVLGSGWPPNKTYKWKDTRALMQFGLEHYFETVVFDETFERSLPVYGGQKESVRIRGQGKLSMILSEYDDVRVYYNYPQMLSAPVERGDTVGEIYVSINGKVEEIFDIKALEEIKALDYGDYLKKTLNEFVGFY